MDDPSVWCFSKGSYTKIRLVLVEKNFFTNGNKRRRSNLRVRRGFSPSSSQGFDCEFRVTF